MGTEPHVVNVLFLFNAWFLICATSCFRQKLKRSEDMRKQRKPGWFKRLGYAISLVSYIYIYIYIQDSNQVKILAHAPKVLLRYWCNVSKFQIEMTVLSSQPGYLGQSVKVKLGGEVSPYVGL